MPLIHENDRGAIRERLKEMENDVRLINFTQEFECSYCSETRQLMEELEELSDKLSVKVFDFLRNKEPAEKYNVDKIPATIILGEKDYGIRYFGIPSGYEFATLLEDIIMVSSGDSGLSAASREKLATLDQPLHIKVFVTPT